MAPSVFSLLLLCVSAIVFCLQNADDLVVLSIVFKALPLQIKLIFSILHICMCKWRVDYTIRSSMTSEDAVSILVEHGQKIFNLIFPLRICKQYLCMYVGICDEYAYICKHKNANFTVYSYI